MYYCKATWLKMTRFFQNNFDLLYQDTKSQIIGQSWQSIGVHYKLLHKFLKLIDQWWVCLKQLFVRIFLLLSFDIARVENQSP